MKLRKHTAAILVLGILGGATAVAASLWVDGLGVSGWHEATRVTARFSSLVFLLAFVSGPLARLFPGALPGLLLYQRRGIGLAFGGSHSVHLATAFTYLSVGGIPPAAMTLFLEAIGYVLIVLMMVTSNDWSVSRLGPKRWCYLHTFGSYYIWAVFVAVFAVRVSFRPDDLIYAILLVLLLLGFLARVAVLVRQHR